VRAKDSDDYGALLSEKPAAPAKRDEWVGFGRDATGAAEEKGEEVQSESASWEVLNQIGVEVSAHNRLLVKLVVLWIRNGCVGLR
jgi:hypothetical protein